MPYLLASPDAGVVLPTCALMILAAWIGINLLISVLRAIFAPTDARRGFDVMPAKPESDRDEPST